ncbi:MAG: hypothetical protein U0P81_08235 [Holophagaceae bacterium]
MRPHWLALPTLFLLACASPKVVPSRSEERFRLGMLRDQKVAVWPIPSADLDESTAGTVTKEYNSQGKFLDALSVKFSGRVIGLCRPNSMGSEQVIRLLNGSEGTKGLLDPGKLLGTADPNNRFATAPDLSVLTKIDGLQGMKYAIVFRDLSIGRQWTHNGGGGGAFVGNGSGGGVFVGGGGSSAKSSARLRLAIIDLESKSIVWDGSVFAAASSTFMKVTALHEIEDDLATNFINEIMGIH